MANNRPVWSRGPRIQPNLGPRRSYLPKSNMRQTLLYENPNESRKLENRSERINQEKRWIHKTHDRQSRAFVVRQIFQEAQMQARGSTVSLLPPDLVENNLHLAMFHNISITGAKDLPMYQRLSRHELEVVQSKFSVEEQEKEDRRVVEAQLAASSMSPGGHFEEKEAQTTFPDIRPSVGQRTVAEGGGHFARVSTPVRLMDKSNTTLGFQHSKTDRPSVPQTRRTRDHDHDGVTMAPIQQNAVSDDKSVRGRRVRLVTAAPHLRTHPDDGHISLPKRNHNITTTKPPKDKLSKSQVRKLKVEMARRREKTFGGTDETKRYRALRDHRFTSLTHTLTTGRLHGGKESGFCNLSPSSWPVQPTISLRDVTTIRNKYMSSGRALLAGEYFHQAGCIGQLGELTETQRSKSLK